MTVEAFAGGGWQTMPATVWADALDRYRAMPLPERAAEVMATIAPALASSFDEATWKHGIEYAVSPDGLAAVERGDVAEVVGRRLPD